METIFKADLLTEICCKKQVRKMCAFGGERGKAPQQRLDPWFSGRGVWDPVVTLLKRLL